MSSRLVIGSGSQAVGTYNLLDGTVNAPNVDIGNGGTGTFDQSGGIDTVASAVYIAGGASSSGTYHLSGGRLNSSVIWVGSAGTGTFNQSGGENVLAGNLHISSSQNSVGTYNLSDGSLSAAAPTWASVATGLLVQSGGSHTLTDALVGRIDARLGHLPAQRQRHARTPRAPWSATIGPGLFQQSGGDCDTDRQPDPRLRHRRSGEYYLSGRRTNGGEHFRRQPRPTAGPGCGLFSQTGGTHTLSGTLTIAGTALGAANPTAHGTYDLSGGTLTAASVLNYDHFNFFGGELNAPVTNYGTFTLSGPGTRTIDMPVDNSV